MKFVLDQTVRTASSCSSNQIFMLYTFEYSFIQHLVFHHCVECKSYAVECVLNVFVDIRMSIIWRATKNQKKRRSQTRREKKQKWRLRKKRIQMQKKIGPTMRFPWLLTCSKQTLMRRASHWLYQPWHKREHTRRSRIKKYGLRAQMGREMAKEKSTKSGQSTDELYSSNILFWFQLLGLRKVGTL